MQRSGTHFTGKILSYSPDTVLLFEPLNPFYGIEGVDCSFPYISYDYEEDKYIRLLNDFFSYKARYKKNYSKDHLTKKIVKYLLGSRTNIRYQTGKIRKNNKARFIIHDPYSAFVSEYMSKQHNCYVLVLIRHPGAVLSSYKRLGWSFEPKRFIYRENLMRDHLTEFEHLLQRDDKSLVTKVGLLWVCIYKILRTYYQRNDSFLFISHEDLCFHPIETFKTIYDWTGLTFTDRIEKEIVKMTRLGNPVKARNNRVQDYKRDSRKLATSWKESISIDERNILREITEPISCHYYDDNSWK